MARRKPITVAQLWQCRGELLLVPEKRTTTTGEPFPNARGAPSEATPNTLSTFSDSGSLEAFLEANFGFEMPITEI